MILAIDGSGKVASVALVEEGRLLGEYSINNGLTHSQTLMPMIDALMNTTGTAPEELEAIAVSGGPGSFTGLRIASSTAKGFGLALDIPIISVPTVDCIAYNLFAVNDIICPMMDARRDQTYTGLYTFEGEEMICLSPQKAVSVDEILEEIEGYKKPVVFLGDGVPVFKETIDRRLQLPHSYAPIHLSLQRGAALGALALKYYQRGEYQSAAEHSPDYLRLSQAERLRKEREKT